MEQNSTVRATAEALYDAYNRHDSEAAAALYAPDGEHEEIAFSQPRQGHKALAGGLRRFFDAFPDARWDVRDVFLDGDRAAVSYVLTGTLQNDLGSVIASGQQMNLRGVLILEMTSSGLIQRTEDYWDSATFERQMQHASHQVIPAEEW